MSKVVAVTGCLGFIGGYVTRRLLKRGDYVLGIDAGTYAANRELVGEFTRNQNFRLWETDIRYLKHLPSLDAILHLAAETHVDNSIQDPAAFIQTNVVGTHVLLEHVRAKRAYEQPLFVHISTDEVYGDSYAGVATEETRLAPSSPYAASKVAADGLVVSYGRTYGLRCRILRPSNCYGFDQYPEKLIPKALRCLRLGQKVPVHGDGSQERSWLAVTDAAEAIITVLDRGVDGQVYNVAGNAIVSVKELVHRIVAGYHHMEIEDPDWEAYVSYGHERLGQDQRYCVSDARLRGLGWVPTGNLFRDLPALVSEETPIFRW